MYDSESCSSIENYFIDNITEEDCSNNNAELCSNSNNIKERDINILKSYTNLSNNLAQWAIEFKISHIALNSLVSILNKYNCTLPCDTRTLLKTQRKASVCDMYNGKYCYFGIANNLKEIFSKVSVLQALKDINLFVNIDGIPLANSSSIQFWPILCKINQTICEVEPFIVAVYCGNSKPLNIHDYLTDFIQEYKILYDVGIIINSKLYSVSISAFICDAPARAFIKQVKGHNGFYGCERCIQRGTHPFGATIFNEIDSELRTNESFLLQTHVEHHNGVSSLTEINFPMVTGFILDSMHLLYLGIMRRILCQFVQGNNYFYKLDTKRINSLSERLETLIKHIPLDFARKPRSLNKIKNWKATELRLFLLYIGLFVFNKIIPNNYIDHFLILHTAIYILSHPKLAVQLCDYAQYLLLQFVKSFDDFYGPGSTIYNVHNLIHLSDDVRTFGKPLDDISAFDFENLLGKIKRSLRSGHKPLSQLSRRLSESNLNAKKFTLKRELKGSHKCGPLIVDNESFVNQYKKIIFDKHHFIICRQSDSDCYALLKDNTVVQIFNIVIKSSQQINRTNLICKQFLKYDNYFNYPCDSKKLQIFRISKLQNSFKIVILSQIKAKCIVFQDSTSYIAYPLLHTITM